jgi:hypothetical protein
MLGQASFFPNSANSCTNSWPTNTWPREAAIYLENARLLAPNDPRTARDLERLSQIKKN